MNYLFYFYDNFSDIDECKFGKNFCRNGQCRNTHGSFTCVCDPGFSVKTDTKDPGCTGIIVKLTILVLVYYHPRQRSCKGI